MQISIRKPKKEGVRGGGEFSSLNETQREIESSPQKERNILEIDHRAKLNIH